MKRVLPYLLLFMCIGIYIADKTQNIPLVLLGSGICSVICAAVTKRPAAALFPCMILVGMQLTLAFATDRHADHLMDAAAAGREDAEVTGVVTSFYKKDDNYVYKIKSKSIILASGAVDESYGLRLISPQQFAVGDMLRIKARIYAHNGKFNPSDFDAKLYLKIHGYDYSFYCDEPGDAFIEVCKNGGGVVNTLHNIMLYLRDKVGENIDSTFGAKQAGILKAITVGDRSGIDDETADAFRNAGIYHFLAISGLHLSVAAGLFMLFAGRYNKRAAYVMTAVFAALYWLMTGGSVSVTRALLMLYILLLSKILYKKYDLINSISLSALILLFINPLYFYDTGFRYSFGAVFGIALMFMHISKIKSHQKLAAAAAASVGATAFPRLITLTTFYTLDLFEIFANIVLIPFMSLITAYASVFTVFSLALPQITPIFAKPLELMLDILIFISDRLADVCVIKVGFPTYTVLCLCLIATLLFILLMLKPCLKRLVPVIFAIPVIFAAAAVTRDRGVSINFLYVGQGDSCVIKDNDDAYIIDCGGNILSDIGKDSGRYRIMPFLDYSGIKRVKAVFISHTDTDHIKGLFDMIGNVDIEKVYISEFADQNDNYEKLMSYAQKYDIRVERLSAGEKADTGRLSFKCIFPLEKNYKSSNKNSMVLLFEHGSNSVLFTGDITKSDESLLCIGDISADVLKLAHHGSKTSSSEAFLQTVDPDIAVVSAGKNNYFGHPAQEVRARLKNLGIPLYATYDGMIKFKSDGERLVLCLPK